MAIHEAGVHLDETCTAAWLPCWLHPVINGTVEGMAISVGVGGPLNAHQYILMFSYVSNSDDFFCIYVYNSLDTFQHSIACKIGLHGSLDFDKNCA